MYDSLPEHKPGGFFWREKMSEEMTNKQKVEYIFKAREVAEVTYTDFAKLTRISRETLYRWRNGAPAKDELRLGIALTYAVRFEKACRAGLLPLKDKLNADMRLKTYRKIVAEMAKK